MSDRDFDAEILIVIDTYFYLLNVNPITLSENLKKRERVLI